MTREEAIDVLKHNYPSACFEDLCEAVEIAIQALSAQPERKKGRWVKQNPFVDTEECSICKYNIYSEELETPFCPWCGAEMEINDAEVY